MFRLIRWIQANIPRKRWCVRFFGTTVAYRTKREMLKERWRVRAAIGRKQAKRPGVLVCGTTWMSDAKLDSQPDFEGY